MSEYYNINPSNTIAMRSPVHHVDMKQNQLTQNDDMDFPNIVTTYIFSEFACRYSSEISLISVLLLELTRYTALDQGL